MVVTLTATPQAVGDVVGFMIVRVITSGGSLRFARSKRELESNSSAGAVQADTDLTKWWPWRGPLYAASATADDVTVDFQLI